MSRKNMPLEEAHLFSIDFTPYKIWSTGVLTVNPFLIIKYQRLDSV